MNSESKLTPQELIKVHKEEFSILSKTPKWAKVASGLFSLSLIALGLYSWISTPIKIEEFVINGYLGMICAMMAISVRPCQ